MFYPYVKIIFHINHVLLYVKKKQILLLCSGALLEEIESLVHRHPDKLSVGIMFLCYYISIVISALDLESWVYLLNLLLLTTD